MEGIENISMKEIENYMSDAGYIIIDLRSMAEYQRNHIEGAVNIPYQSIVNEEVEISKDRIPVLYCEHGGVSIMAARILMRRGYKVINTIGGIRAYERLKQKR